MRVWHSQRLGSSGGLFDPGIFLLLRRTGNAGVCVNPSEDIMSKFKQFYTARYGAFPTVMDFDGLMRMSDCMAEFADECARVAESRLVRLHRAEKRLARATKIKAVSMRSLDELRDEFVKPEPTGFDRLPAFKFMNGGGKI